MSANSKIEWTNHTFNPWIGCTKVSPACDHCYAEVSTPSRALGVTWGAGQPRRMTGEANWKEPLRWNGKHDKFFAEHGRRQRVFCASLADVFDNEAPLGARERLFQLIEQTPNLDWLLLTKRIGNVPSMIPARWAPGLPPNVWLGISVVNQLEADRDIPKLLNVPAAVRFLSMEPLLGPVDLTWLAQETDGVYDALRGGSWILGNEQVHPVLPNWRYNDGTSSPREYLNSRRLMGRHVDWVIVGGESGPHARPMHPNWARSLRDQCASAGVPFLYKQWGEWLPATRNDNLTLTLEFHDAKHTGPAKPEWQHFDGASFAKVGKKAAGRMLDGRTHDEFPKGAA